MRLLREVGLRGSIAGAARAVGLTASAVSQQLAVLEREAGAALLDRSPRGVALTGAGQRWPSGPARCSTCWPPRVPTSTGSRARSPATGRGRGGRERGG